MQGRRQESFEAGWNRAQKVPGRDRQARTARVHFFESPYRRACVILIHAHAHADATAAISG